MSGPVTTDDATPTPNLDSPVVCELEVIEGRAAEVAGFRVRRVLPRRPRRTVGAWCFADQIGPGSVTEADGLDIGPHPHIGLQTVTWLLRGAILHRDSLGSEQLIRPGQLNLMTAGHGVSHSEETAGVYTGELHGIQLWVAQPSSTRDGEAAFEHHAELPQQDVGNGMATVIIGEFMGMSSPARRDTDHVGVALELRQGSVELPLDPEFEHAVIALDNRVTVERCPLGAGSLGYLGLARDVLRVDVSAPARLLLIGGRPFPEPLLMWWNYVARTCDEVSAAHEAWMSSNNRFGVVASPLDRMSTAPPSWTDSSGTRLNQKYGPVGHDRRPEHASAR